MAYIVISALLCYVGVMDTNRIMDLYKMGLLGSMQIESPGMLEYIKESEGYIHDGYSCRSLTKYVYMKLYKESTPHD